MKSPWKYPGKNFPEPHAHDINRAVMDDPDWRISVINNDIGALNQEIQRLQGLVRYWKEQRAEWEAKKLKSDVG